MSEWVSKVCHPTLHIIGERGEGGMHSLPRTMLAAWLSGKNVGL